MPKTHVVHLGNSNELMEIAEDSVAKRILREHVRESLGVRNEDILFAIINSKPFPLILLCIAIYHASILIKAAFLNTCLGGLLLIYFLNLSNHYDSLVFLIMLYRLFFNYCTTWIRNIGSFLTNGPFLTTV